MSQVKRTEGKPATDRVVLRSAALPPEQVPTTILVAPWGQVESTSGSFVVDSEAGRLVVEAFDEQGNDLPIDYEHQSLGGRFASPTGQAPAAGWIKRLAVVEGEGIYADVEWTPQALEQLAAKQYRYLSPVAVVRRQDRRLIGLHSAALTNKPAIAGMEPIVNRTDAAAGAEGAAQTWEALAAARREVQELKETLARRQAEDRVLAAMSAGKLTEAQRAWAIDFAVRLPAEFEAWHRSAPVVVPCGRSEPPAGRSAPGSDRRSVAERARREFGSDRLLGLLTSEEAYVADALRTSATDER